MICPRETFREQGWLVFKALLKTYVIVQLAVFKDIYFKERPKSAKTMKRLSFEIF